VPVEAWEGEALPRLEDISAVVVFGGSMNVDQTDRYPYLAAEVDLLRDASRQGLPVLGVCLGAQLLAKALGAPVTLAPEREFGFFALRLTAEGERDPVVSSFPNGSNAFQWHEDTFSLPGGAVRLANGADGEAPGLQAFRAGSSVAVQFHPEVEAEELETWFADAGPSAPATWGRTYDDVRAQMRTHLATHNERGRELFRRFAAGVTA
jgi:GMP synthase-like glutamine amidotransferase